MERWWNPRSVEEPWRREKRNSNSTSCLGMVGGISLRLSRVIVLDWSCKQIEGLRWLPFILRKVEFYLTEPRTVPRINWPWRSSRFYTESFQLQLHVLGSWSQPLGTVDSWSTDPWWIPAIVSVGLCILTRLLAPPSPYPCCQRIQRIGLLILCCGFSKNKETRTQMQAVLI